MHACGHARVSSSPGWPQIPVSLRLAWNTGSSHFPDLLIAGIRAPATVMVHIHSLVTLFLIHWGEGGISLNMLKKSIHSPPVLSSLPNSRLETAKLRVGTVTGVKLTELEAWSGTGLLDAVPWPRAQSGPANERRVPFYEWTQPLRE